MASAPALLASAQDIDWLGHALRNPMAALHGAIDLLAAGAVGPVPEAVAQALAIAQWNSQRLGRLLDDLLEDAPPFGCAVDATRAAPVP
jgi:signal transduction histidine kinase